MEEAHDWRAELARARRIADNLNDPDARQAIESYIRELQKRLRQDVDDHVVI